MKVEVITLFPSLVEGFLSQSIIKRAQDFGILEVCVHNLRSWTTNKHQQADDYLFGGGAGMLLKPEPFFRALTDILAKAPHRPLIIYPTAIGEPFKQNIAEELSREGHLIFICGHYKGIDQRVVERFVDREYSLGDYVITGGELASAIIIDAAVRLIPGVLGDFDSARDDSFQEDRLDAPHYTRPEEYAGLKIPEVVRSGHHRNIAHWRQALSLAVTKLRRPDIVLRERCD